MVAPRFVVVDDELVHLRKLRQRLIAALPDRAAQNARVIRHAVPQVAAEAAAERAEPRVRRGAVASHFGAEHVEKIPLMTDNPARRFLDRLSAQETQRPRRIQADK